jgi:peptide/nickel transport system substrate-binding protein
LAGHLRLNDQYSRREKTTMKRLCLIVAGLLTALHLAAAPAAAGKKDDTLVWATDRDNPIADPFYINTRELVVIGHEVWDTLVIIDPKTAEIKPLLATN